MKNLIYIAAITWAYEYLKSKGHIKGWKITNAPIQDQALDAVTNPKALFIPEQSEVGESSI